MMNFTKNQKGELLMNLIVTLAIISLLTVMSIPILKNYQPSVKLSLVARDLTSDLRYAQQKTITEQYTHLIAISTSTKSYQLQRLSPATTTLKSVSLPAEVSFDLIDGLTNNTIIFNPYGAANESGTIRLINTSSTTKTINIKPSGYVELE